MLFANKIKKIQLAKNLKMGVGRDSQPQSHYWLLGLGCLVVALLVTNFSIRQPRKPEGAILGVATERPAVPNFNEYKTQTGDTMFSISQKLNVPVEILSELNGIMPPFTIRAGQILKIPAAQK